MDDETGRHTGARQWQQAQGEAGGGGRSKERTNAVRGRYGSRHAGGKAKKAMRAQQPVCASRAGGRHAHAGARQCSFGRQAVACVHGVQARMRA